MFDKKNLGLTSQEGAGAADESSYPRAEDYGKREEQITFRLKSAAGIGFALLILYSGVVILSGPERPRQSAPEAKLYAPPSRSVKDAKAREGILQRLFCRGLQRSSFCD